MTNAKELKPKSFRLDDETAKKFKEIAKSVGGNQQETMQLLINSYHMQTQKVELLEHKANIEEFERYITTLITMYTQSLQASHDMRKTVMQEFNATLKSKEAIIKDLQDRLEEAEQLKKEAVLNLEKYVDENTKLNDSMTSLKTALKDKDVLNESLKATCNSLNEKVKNMEEKAELLDLYQEETEKLKNEKEELEVKYRQNILQIKELHQEEIQKLHIDKHAEIDKYQQKCQDLLEQINKIKKTNTNTKK